MSSQLCLEAVSLASNISLVGCHHPHAPMLTKAKSMCQCLPPASLVAIYFMITKVTKLFYFYFFAMLALCYEFNRYFEVYLRKN